MDPHTVSTCDDFPICLTEDAAFSDRNNNNNACTPVKDYEELKNEMQVVPINQQESNTMMQLMTNKPESDS